MGRLGGIIVVVWLLPFRVIEAMVPDARMDFSMWVVGGLLVVVGATWTVIYNADLLLGGMTATLGRIRALTGVLRISAAYPLKTRLRTGMTLAMFTLVVFTLVVGTTTTSAFLSAFSHVDQFSGGFDVRAGTSSASPIDNMAAALRKAPGVDASKVTVVASQSYVPVDVRQAGVGAKFVAYPLRGLDDSYLRNTTYQLAGRASGYSSDRAVWDAVRTGSRLAVVDANIVPHRRNWSFGSVTELHQSPWHTTYLHHPYGSTLIGQTLNPFNGLAGIALLKVFSLVQTYNIMVIFSFVMSGLIQPKVSGSGTWPAITNYNQLGFIVQANSGLPFNIRANRDLNLDGVQDDRPIGIGRNAGRLGRYVTFDLRYVRFIPLGRVRPELFVEGKNIFNDVNVSGVNRVVAVDAAGNPTAPLVFPGTSGYPLQRSLQAGVKVSF